MKHSLPFSVTAIISAIIFINCESPEIGYSKDVNPETVYMEYSINAEQNEDSVDCILQYRFAGESGTTLILSEPGNVAIDGIVLNVDTSFGAFYEKKFAVNDFNGEHTITYTDINGETFEEKFSYQQTTCITVPAAICNKEDMLFSFAGTEPKDDINIKLSDTSNATDDILITAKPYHNQIIIPAAQLKNLNNGPCSIEIYKTVETPLQHSTPEGGKITINQFIKEMQIKLTDTLYL